MKTLRLFAILCISFTLILFTAVETSKSCGYGYEETPEITEFFNPTIIHEPEYTPFFMFHGQSKDEGLKESIHENDNIREWKSYFSNTPKEEDIQYLVYKMPLSDLKRIKEFINHSIPNDTILQNSLLHYWWKQHDSESIKYLCFAKECEPFVTNIWDWSEEDRTVRLAKNGNSMEMLIEQGKQFYSTCTSDYLKMRYGYQIVRLAHYLDKFQSCLDLYQKYVEPLTVRSIIKDWALGHKAGALWKLNSRAEAAYLYSLLFSRCPSMRDRAIQSFRIQNDSIWSACISLCKSPDEKTTLYFLRATESFSNSLEEMKEIYLLDSNSPYLNVLLTREINKIEKILVDDNILTKLESFRGVRGINDEMKTEWFLYLTQLHKFIDNCVQKGDTKNPDVWKLALGYTYHLLGDAMSANKMYNELLQHSTDDEMRNMVYLFEIISELSQLQKIDYEVEEKMYDRVVSTDNNNLLKFMINKFEKLYEKQGDTLKAFLCYNNIASVKLNPQMNQIEELLSLAKKKPLSRIEQFILLNTKRADLSNSWFEWNYENSFRNGNEGPINFLNEIKGTILFSKNKLEDALAIFRKLPPGLFEESVPDPFLSRINDCRDCDFAIDIGTHYNKLTMIQRMLELQSLLQSDPANAAEYHFQLGNAYYNLTHFGNASEKIDYHRNRDDYLFEDTNDFYDCTLALQHYVEGMNLAEDQGNNELAATCCFMAAKCEQNKYYTDKPNDQDGNIKNLSYRKYFRIMKDKYTMTSYYQEVINECEYFKSFVDKY
ncbi:MAG: hypothetical protein HY960_09875 [Ignavibacteriae bacterium]|nr:hypothetical protein [Ignavibacteriota bacterium]